MPFRVEETTIEEIHAAFGSGELTCRSLVEAYLVRIEKYDGAGPELNAIITVNPRALEAADELDQAWERGDVIGPLHGIPVLVKDQAETAGTTTTFGSEAFADYVPSEDATVVKRLKEAGAVILAKTNLPDFATSWFAYSSSGGITKNPYSTDRDPGGSSSGTGAGIAANFGVVGVGEDTGGSIRVPASFNNLVGLRPTTGLVSRKGLSPLVTFQDTAGPMARTVRDAAILLDAMVGYDPEDPFTVAATLASEYGKPGGYAENLGAADLGDARIGVLRDAFGDPEDPDCAAVTGVVEGAVEALRAAGATIVDPVELPGLADHIGVTSLYLSQSRYDIDQFLSTRPGKHTVSELFETKRFHPRLDLFIEIHENAPENPEDDPNYYRGLAAREVFRREILKLMAEHRLDAILFPNSQVLPPTRQELDDWKWTVLTFPTNALIAAQSDLPSICLPAGFSNENIPVGFEMIGRSFAEAKLLSLALAYELAAKPRRSPDTFPPLADPAG